MDGLWCGTIGEPTCQSKFGENLITGLTVYSVCDMALIENYVEEKRPTD